MSDLVSIIVPVYNVEENILRRCIKSLIYQSYADIQIILVDDGSSDMCKNICDEYALSDSRIKVIHKENGGVSSARNAGLKITDAEYITFVDSDDFVSTDYINNLYTALKNNNADCAMCACVSFSDEQTIPNYSTKHEYKVFTKDEIINDMCYMIQPFENFEITAVWGVLYKKSIIENIFFNENIAVGEDFVFKYYAMKNVEIVVVSSEADYYYYIHPESAMRNGFSQKKLQSVDEFENILSNEQIAPYYSPLLSRFVNIAIVILFMIPLGKEYRSYREKIISFIKKYRNWVLNDKNIRIKLKGALYLSCIVGFDNTKRIFELLK